MYTVYYACWHACQLLHLVKSIRLADDHPERSLACSNTGNKNPLARCGNPLALDPAARVAPTRRAIRNADIDNLDSLLICDTAGGTD
jgi:hypothetical protein